MRWCGHSTVADPVAGWGWFKHEIYAAAFGGHLFYDLFSQGRGEAWPPRPPPDPLLIVLNVGLPIFVSILVKLPSSS